MSEVECEQVTTICRARVVPGPLGGSLSRARMDQIERCVLIALDIVLWRPISRQWSPTRTPSRAVEVTREPLTDADVPAWLGRERSSFHSDVGAGLARRRVRPTHPRPRGCRTRGASNSDCVTTDVSV